MHSLIRKVRGVIGTGVTWALGWSLAGGALHVLGLLLGWGGFFGPSLLDDVLAPGLLGLVGGSLFAKGFLLTEGRRELDELRVRRGAAWGAAAGLVGPIVFFVAFGADAAWLRDLWPLFVGTAVLGATSGGAMTAIARRDDTDRLVTKGDAAAATLGSGGPVPRDA